MSSYAGTVARTCYAEPVTFPATYAAPPGALCSFRSSRAAGHTPTVCRPASLAARHPQSPPRAASGDPPKPPATGGSCARVRPRCRVQLGSRGARRAKEEIVHPASLVDPSTPSAPLSLYAVRSRSPHSASFTNSPLSARYGWRLLPPRRASAAFALRSPIASFRFSCLFVFFVVKPSFRIGELHANSAQALQEHSESPADPNGSCFSGRRLPSNHQPPGPVFLRGPYGLPCGAMEPSAEGALQFRRIRFAKFGHLLHRSLRSLSLPCGGGPARYRAQNPSERSKSHNAHYAFAMHISLSAPGSLKQKPFC